jgi:hypothetical protein
MPNIKSRVYENIFTPEEIKILQRDQDVRPVVLDTNGIIDKNLDYHIKHSISHKIIRPKINEIIGHNHDFSSGCYKEAHRPYQTHVDNSMFQNKWYKFTTNFNHNSVVLIPLVEGPQFNTAFFNVWSDEDLGMGQLLPDQYLTESNNVDLNLFTHIKEPVRAQISKLSVDNIWSWKLGNVIVWNRNQLHSSTDFAKYGLVKKFAVLFLA